MAGCKYGLRETASRKRRIQEKSNTEREEPKVEAPKVVDIRIETEKRKKGTRIERVTQVRLARSKSFDRTSHLKYTVITWGGYKVEIVSVYKVQIVSLYKV